MCVDKNEMDKLFVDRLKVAEKRFKEQMDDCNEKSAERIDEKLQNIVEKISLQIKLAENKSASNSLMIQKSVDVLSNRQREMNSSVSKHAGLLNELTAFQIQMQSTHTPEGRSIGCAQAESVRVIENWILGEISKREAQNKIEKEKTEKEARDLKKASVEEARKQNFFNNRSVRVAFWIGMAMIALTIFQELIFPVLREQFNRTFSSEQVEDKQ